MDNKAGKDNTALTERLQLVYDRIKRERPWDIRFAKKMYITTKEKYMIELMKEGHIFPDETIDHVVSGCDENHKLSGEEYACCYGYILKEKEYRLLKCESLCRINKRLFCHNGAVSYLADLLSNPLDKWEPYLSTASPEVQEVYDMIEEKLSDKKNLDEFHKKNLKHLLDLIVRGNTISKQVKSHVVYGCARNEEHHVDDNYICKSGFLVRKGKSKTDRKSYFRDYWKDFYINLIKNSLGKYVNISDYITKSDRECMKRIFERICNRDFIRHNSTTEVRLTWQEQYLIDCVMSGENVPNEVVSHVVEGCHARGHLLTEKYACCRGYILMRETFFQHDIRGCRLRHQINDDLMCCNGNIHHNCDEDFVSRLANGFKSPPSVKTLVENVTANPRLPPGPAPIPPDHLDDRPVQQRVFRNSRRNLLAAVIRQRNNEVNSDDDDDDDNDDEAIVQNVAPNFNRHPNPAPPPPEFDI